MTTKTWKLEFMPKPIRKNMSARAATEHCVMKWSGLNPANLKKHGLIKIDDEAELQEKNNHSYEGGILINGRNCALCVVYYEAAEACNKCPLYLARGGTSCDRQMEKELRSPFEAFERLGDPKPMIRELKKTLKYLTKKEAK